MQTIGRYEVVDRMGSGGFATVYRARDPQLDSHVAIKVLAENWADNPEFKDRFMREAQLLRRIDSDHVVTVHDVGVTSSGQPYFVMALADRGTLEDRLADRPPPTGNDAVAIAERLSDCVGTIHSYDLIHRDIKPSNLLIAATRRLGRQPVAAGILASDERMLLGDFGLAKDTALTGTGLTIAAGTGGYAAPEQMSPTGVPDLRTDVYAATAVMYRVVSGTRPPPFDLASQTVPFVDNDWWMNGELGAFFRRGMAFYQGGRHRDLHEWFEEFRRVVLAGSNPGPTGPGTPGDLSGGATGWDSGRPSEAGTAHWAPPGSGQPNSGQPISGGRVISGPSQESGTSRHPLSQPAVARDGTSSWGPAQPTPGPQYPSPVLPSGVGQRAPSGYDAGQQAAAYRPAPQPSVPYRNSPQPQALRQVGKKGSGGSRLTTMLLLPIIVVVAVGAAWYFLKPSDGPTISGASQAVAGQETTFTAEMEGADQFEWTNFNGSPATGNTFVVTGVLPGSLTLKVKALTADGEELGTATRTIEVVPSPDGPTITGPDRATVGETTEYTFVESDAFFDPRWVQPDGSELPGSTFQLTPTQAGSFTIVLKVTTNDGKDIGVKKEIQLVE